jgi:hypothetical protein
MTPLDYAKSYLYLPVCIDGVTHEVGIRKYLSGKFTSGKDPLWGRLKDHFHKERKKTPFFTHTTKVISFGSAIEASFSGTDEMLHPLIACYDGKGSPEWFQIALQLAVQFKLTTVAQLQDYCDENFGMDCNGFVGNYLFRCVQGRSWKEGHTDRNALGPSSPIDVIVRKPFLKSMNEFRAYETYFMGQVNDDGRVKRGGGESGHVVITQAGMSIMPGLCYDTLSEQRAEKAGAVPTLYVVESTGGLGITKSWYQVEKVDERGVFTVYRGCKGHRLKVRISRMAKS